MSNDNNNNNMSNSNISVCASCGIAKVDEVKLMPQHKEACVKRVADLRDELLFKQPESTHRGDCPICMIPLSLDATKSRLMTCCSKIICIGCDYTSQVREAKASLNSSCSFCRQPLPNHNGRLAKYRMKRIEANDPVALCQHGLTQDKKGDYSVAFEYYTKAAQLGDAEAHYQLAVLYQNGHGVEKDRGKEIHHLEEAAIGGHPDARYNLGCDEEDESGNIERAVKHWIISANLGDDGSIKELMEKFKEGFVSKDDLAGALRAHQAAVDATRSPQRDAAEEYY
eukprot:scaffold13283_cov71-Skeletonema_marinoi.AAC.2